jgi:hypothetical protein
VRKARTDLKVRLVLGVKLVQMEQLELRVKPVLKVKLVRKEIQEQKVLEDSKE